MKNMKIYSRKGPEDFWRGCANRRQIYAQETGRRKEEARGRTNNAVADV